MKKVTTIAIIAGAAASIPAFPVGAKAHAKKAIYPNGSV